MKPAHFPEANTTLMAPPGAEETVRDLPVWRGSYPDGQAAVVSCWRPSWREWLALLFRRRIWFHCWGTTHPPIFIGATEPFERARDAEGAH